MKKREVKDIETAKFILDLDITFINEYIRVVKKSIIKEIQGLEVLVSVAFNDTKFKTGKELALYGFLVNFININIEDLNKIKNSLIMLEKYLIDNKDSADFNKVKSIGLDLNRSFDFLVDKQSKDFENWNKISLGEDVVIEDEINSLDDYLIPAVIELGLLMEVEDVKKLELKEL